jgi:uncharacterized lipoprotein YddW (UPF0748 family)
VRKITSQNKTWLWLDPGERDAQAYSLKVILDVVKRYDIDGVQFDDYFYPDQDPGPAGPADFPDDASWKKFGANGKLKRADWRRENVNAFVEHVYLSIKTAKPWVKFGISPRGIWRPGNPPQIKGTDDFNEHFADSRKWLANGWLDYCSPQLYWAIETREQSFPVLLQWWSEQNAKGRHLWPGIAAYRVKPGQWQPEEIRQQIQIARAETDGYLFFSASNVIHNVSLSGMLEREVGRTSTLVPASPWLGSRPDRPALNSTNSSSSLVSVSWQASGTNIVRLWVLQTRSNEIWNTEILPANRTSQIFKDPIPDAVAVSAVDRAGNRSQPAALVLKLKPSVAPAAAASPATAQKPAKREPKRYQSPKAIGQ